MSSRLRRHDHCRHDGDRGSVLLLTLVLVVVGGLIVGSLLTYVSTVIRVRPPLEARNAGFEAARSGIRMAVTLQREVGPEACFSETPFTQSIDGRNVTVRCTTLDTTLSGLGRLGLVSTANLQLRDDLGNISGGADGAAAKVFQGAMFLNAGTIHERTVDLVSEMPVDDPVQLLLSRAELAPDQPLRRYVLDPSLVVVPDEEDEGEEGDGEEGDGEEGDGEEGDGEDADDPAMVDCLDPLLYDLPHFGGAPLVECVDAGWNDRVGDRPEGADGWQYPQLPQVPSFARPGSQSTIGTCNVYFPGRYDTVDDQPIVLDGGRHYFASGVYVLNAPLVIRNGADVVTGEGQYRGCSFDADAAFSPTAPRNHEITGKGATFVLGDGGRIEVDRASLRMNRRVASASTRASDSVSIIVANGAIDTPEVTVPESQVLGADGDSVAMSSHSITPTTGQPAVSYRASTLAPLDYALDLRLDGGDVATNRVFLEGYVFVPNAGVRVDTGASEAYGLRLNGGVVATTLEFDMAAAPGSGGTFFAGLIAEVVKRQVRLVSSTTVDDEIGVSTAIFEVHRDGSYAINSWTLNE